MKYLLFSIFLCCSFLSVSAQTTITFGTVTEATNYADNNASVKKIIITGTVAGNDYSPDSEWSKFRTLNTVFPNLDTVQINTAQNIPDGNYMTGGFFSNAYWLKGFYAPQVKRVGMIAFSYCIGLDTIRFPAAEQLGNGAFLFCSRLTSADFPQVTAIESYTFQNCRSLSSVNFPFAATIGEDAFAFCTGLTEVVFPQAAKIDDFAFNPCPALLKVNFPRATAIGDHVFSNNRSLNAVSFGTDFTAPAGIHFGRCVFGLMAFLTRNIDLTLGENVLPNPSENIWQHDNVTISFVPVYRWKSITSIPTANIVLTKLLPVNVYPNPVRDQITIRFEMETSGQVTIALFDVSGRKVKDIRNTFAEEGLFTQTTSIGHLPTGVYVLTLMINNNLTTKKLIKE